MNLFLDATDPMGTGITAVLSQIISSIGDLVNTVASTPILAIGVTVFLVGAVIGLTSRLIRV